MVFFHTLARQNLLMAVRCLIVILVFVTNTLYAQSIVLDSVLVSGVRNQYQNQKLDTTVINVWNLASLKGISLNVQGPSALTSVLNRGMSSKHFSFLYNGMPINGATTGVYDASMIPFYYFNNSVLLNQGVNGVVGNHSLAGGLDLNSVHTQYSFINVLGSQVINKTNIFKFKQNGELQNSLPYKLNGVNFNTDIIHTFNEHVGAKLSVWMQDFNRDVVGPYYMKNGQSQVDKNNRYSAELWFNKNKVFQKLSLQYFDEFIGYNATGIDSRANTNVIAINYKLALSDIATINIGNKNEVVNANFFNGKKVRNDWSLFANKKIILASIHHLLLSLNQHIVDEKLLPFNFDLKYNFRQFEAAYSKQYNLPGLNDLYWPSGGNIHLKPETAHQFNFKFKKGKNGSSVIIGLYSYHINDYIVWQPVNATIWSPSNLKKIWSRGGDIEVSRKIYHNKIVFQPMLNYSFTRATNIAKEDANRHKQLIYIPLHKATVSVITSYKDFILSSSILYLGKRYDTTDNYLKLPHAFVSNLRLQHFYTKSKFQCQVSIATENIFKTDYAYVRSFPMPLSRVGATILLKYNL
jgi:vitamin B12 transporter